MPRHWQVVGMLLAWGVTSIASGADRPYRVPRLADGRPDLQGMWVHSNATPLERPQEVPTATLNREQAQALHAKQVQVLGDPSKLGEPLEYFDERRYEPVRGTLRSSLIVEPSTGQLPATDLYRRTLGRAILGVLLFFDGPEQRPAPERCLGAVAAQPPMMSTAANNLHQIVQTPTHILIMSETNHEARVIRLDSQHLPAALHSWVGDSIGWWENDTLVIQTRNFNAAGQMRMAVDAAFIISPQATVTERLRRLGPDELSYEFAVEDPTFYTQRWRAESHLLRTPEPMLEFACHEGNYSLRNILEAARSRDPKK